MMALYDLVKREFGPTSERHDLLANYEWNGHDPGACAVLPLMPGFLLRVSKRDADDARKRLGLLTK